MAQMALLQFGDNDNEAYSSEYAVLEWHTHYKRNHNGIRPDGEAICESFDITLVAPDKRDLSLYSWFVDNQEMSGRFVFTDFEGNQPGGKDRGIVTFENAQCFSLSEAYHIDDNTRRLIRLKIAPEEVSFGNYSFHNATI